MGEAGWGRGRKAADMARDEAYRQVEKKIEVARRSGANKLNLISMKLTELPESLGGLTQLQILNLSRNKLTAPALAA